MDDSFIRRPPSPPPSANMSTNTETLINVLYDGQSRAYYSVALTCLYFYDYLLTLPDEVKYAWKGRKTFVFGLFFANRYIPIVYRFWTMVREHYPGYTQSMCDHTVFISVLMYTLSTWIAQIVLITRVYALSGKNRRFTFFLVVLSTIQLALFCWHIVLVATNPAQPMRPVIGLDLQFCVLSRHRVNEVTNTVFSIPFDTLVFGSTVYFTWKQGATKWSLSSTPSLLRTLARDGAIYFLFIFLIHLVYTFTLLLGRPFVQVIPAIGIYVYLPIAVSRLMLSLRKAAVLGEGRIFYSRSRDRFVGASISLNPEVQTVGRADVESIRLKELRGQ